MQVTTDRCQVIGDSLQVTTDSCQVTGARGWLTSYLFVVKLVGDGGSVASEPTEKKVRMKFDFRKVAQTFKLKI